jgi:hypothetical protein
MEEYKSYYECKRCFFKFYQKNDMKRHINKKNLCSRTIESYKICEDKLVELSLIRNKKKEFKNNCSFLQSTKSDDLTSETDLPKINCAINNNEHLNNDSISINNSEINNINNINNISININLLKSFDEDWDTSEIDINKKLILLLNNSKFTKTLEHILENEVNLNVIIDNTSHNGLVYKNKELVIMNIKDIVQKSMEKLHKHLCDFHKDVIDPNKNDVTKNTINMLNNELQTVNEKYDDFKNNEEIKDTVNNFFTNIYNTKKETTIKKYGEITNIGF